MVGTTLGHYRIVRKLGGGGMGEVYVAEDTTLNRKVALKILPAGMADDPERRKRFEREAKSVAALNHPNIVTIHSVEEADGVRFITMEWVQGRNLTEIIPKEGLPLNRFFEMALPLVDAVAAAHQQGITHRDLKPDNIMASDDGRLKVLDFGLAKLREESSTAATESRLATQSVTAEGRIVGTVTYMSPEQAEGKPVDHRSDIFSLGIILYEMATGRRPFSGDTQMSVLSSILKDTPPSVTDLNRDLPRDLGKIIRRCLAKDPLRRFQTSLDLRNELEELKGEVDSGELVPLGASGAVRPAARGRGIWFAAGGAGLTLAVVSVILLLRPVPKSEGRLAPPVTSTFTQITRDSGEELFPSLSPDGKMVAYASQAAGNWDIYLLRVGGENPINLTKDSAADDTQPAFSPDGEWIAFRSGREGGGIFVMGATGESVRRLTDFGYNPSWSPAGKEIVCGTEAIVIPWARTGVSRLVAVDVATGAQREITRGDAVQPDWSPHGHRIAYWAVKGGQRDLWTLPAAGGEATPVTSDIPTDWDPVWSPDGNYLYFSSDRGGSLNLWRLPIEEETGKVLGKPEPVTTGAGSGSALLSFSRDGQRIAYVAGAGAPNLQKAAWDSAAEKVRGEPLWVTRGSEGVTWYDPSPDGERLVYTASGKEDLFVSRVDGTHRRRLTDDPYKDRMPRWSPDGKRIAFYSNRSGEYRVWTINPDGSGLQPIAGEPGKDFEAPVWSPDGSRLAFSTDAGVRIMEPGKPGKDQSFQSLPMPGGAGERFMALSWSPDGRWLAGIISTPSVADAGIAIYSFESKEFERLSQSGYGAVWLADSRRLLFTLEAKILLTDRRSKKSQVVLSVAPDEIVGWLTLSRDYRWLYFSRNRREADIWLLTLK